MPISSEKLKKDLWIIDSGASIHISNSLDGMVNLRDEIGEIVVDNAEVMKYTKVGDFEGTFKGIDSDGETKLLPTTISDVAYLKDFESNIISM